MLEDTSSLQEQDILSAIQETLNTTGVFSLGLEDAKVFPEYMRNMVRLGNRQAGWTRSWMLLPDIISGKQICPPH